MAEKLNEFASKLGKNGGPKGLGIGIKLLAVAAAGAWGVKESMYTGNAWPHVTCYLNLFRFVIKNLTSNVNLIMFLLTILFEYTLRFMNIDY